MPKKIKFESFKYRFLIACEHLHHQVNLLKPTEWKAFINRLDFQYDAGDALVSWTQPSSGEMRVLLRGGQAQFYFRGDQPIHVERQEKDNLLFSDDRIKSENNVFFNDLALKLAYKAGFVAEDVAEDVVSRGTDKVSDRLEIERDFHDAWADSEDMTAIDVVQSNTVCTAPEMRYIAEQLGDLSGKTLLDVGCGLGEASVYFALLGADVTSSDLSQGMLDATEKLAQHNGVSIRKHLASAEDMQLASDQQFDVIYAGNLLHHVEIDVTLERIKKHVKPGGLFVSWDPLHYNPVINIYRAMASDVRTADEHPLKWQDIKLFKSHFGLVKTQYFWLTTLVIFVIMALVQRRNPNKERFWKVILKEGDKWAWLYRPLALLDRLLLAIFPPLRLLCWNVVVICRKSED